MIVKENTDIMTLNFSRDLEYLSMDVNLYSGEAYMVCNVVGREVVSKTQMILNLLGHLQNAIVVVMRTNLIVIVFLKLMGYISSNLMDIFLGEEKP